MDKTILKKWFQKNREQVFHDFFTFLKFESIAADPAFSHQTKECAHWLMDYLTRCGLHVEKWETSGQPVIFAEHCQAGADRPTLLIYQHYDVQPVDPLELWKSPPFEPTIRNGVVYARGAQDNKGQCFYTITAIKAFLDVNPKPNFNLKLFIDGEEESGSKGTQEAIQKHQKKLKSDSLLIVDSGLPAKDVPAITLGSRGIVTFEVKCQAANIDMHSGMMGGIAYNPNRALIETLSTLWDKEGRVAVANFYRDVKPLSKEELLAVDIQIDENKIVKEFGLRAVCPEPGFSLGQSATIRPTLEINGISGGYAGEGFKTVIPAIAKAKISCRLVPDQKPKEIAKALKAHLLLHAPKGLEITVTGGEGAPPFRSSPHSLIAKLSSKAYEEVLGKPCKSLFIGGSIPLAVDLVKASGAEAVMMGYGLDSDQIHSPNEHFGLDRFENGFLTIGTIFSKLDES